MALGGKLIRNLDSEGLKEQLRMIQNKPMEEKKRKRWKGREKNEKETDE